MKIKILKYFASATAVIMFFSTAAPAWANENHTAPPEQVYEQETENGSAKENELDNNPEFEIQETDNTNIDADNNITETELLTPSYSPQPTAIEEIELAIEAWLKGLENKPRWEYQVEENLLPPGWICETDFDEDSGLAYWTIFSAVADALSAIYVDDIDNLNETLSNAPTGAVITLAESLDGAVLNETLVVTKSVTLRAASGTVTIKAAPGQRHMKIDGGGSIQLTFDGIILDGNTGLTVNGGGIVCTAQDITITNAVIRDCNAGDLSFGGAITAKECKLTLDGANTLISGNQASFGAGIYMDSGELVINSGAISGNTAIREGGALYVENGVEIYFNGGIIGGENASEGNTAHIYGGGAVVKKNSKIYINGGNIKYNKVTSENGSGGAGGLLLSDGAYGELTAGYISYNQANSFINSQGITLTSDGGGVLINTLGSMDNPKPARCTFVINGGTIEHNFANKTGGGISLMFDASLEIQSGTIQYNKADNSGGGVALTNNYNNLDFLMSGGKISNNEASMGGGVAILTFNVLGLSFTFNDGQIIDNYAAQAGGGIILYSQSNFTMGGELSGTLTNPIIGNNRTGAQGGGIYAFNSKNIDIVSGEIISNMAETQGGGIFLYSSEAEVKNCLIEKNEASTQGGGIYSGFNVQLDIKNSVLNNNNAQNGGGVYVTKESKVEIDSTVLKGNSAVSDGGAIYTEDFVNYSNLTNNDYSNIITSDTTTFLNNKASNIYEPPSNAQTMFPHLLFETTTGEAHILNNFDVNYKGGNIAPTPKNRYFITYHANGGTGTITDSLSPYEDGAEVTVLSHSYSKGSSTGMTKTDYTFQNWSTEPNGSGTIYNPNDTFTIEKDTILYAIWEKDPVQTNEYTVTYHANGGTGAIIDPLNPYKDGSVVTVLSSSYKEGSSTGISRSGYSFQYWSTQPSGGETRYNSGSTFTISGDTDLYAIWKYNGGGGGSSTDYFNVVYDGNGGVRSSGSGEYRLSLPTGSSHVVLPNTNSNLGFTLAGYEFLGWSNEPNGDVNIRPGDVFTGHANQTITIYALWKLTEEELFPPKITLNREDHNWYITGYPDRSVRPERELTRAEAAAIFFRLTEAEDKEILYSANYPDMNRDDWFYNDVAYLTYHGILVGYEDGTFRPNTPITRAELATLSSKFDALSLNTENLFTDVNDNHWAAVYIASAAEKEWVTGYPDGTFKPNQNITRAETSSLINRVLNRSILLEDLPEGVKQYTDLDESHWAYCDLMEASHSHTYERKNGREIDEVWLSYFYN